MPPALLHYQVTKHDRSACDGAYLALAEKTGDELVTGDKRLRDAVKDPVSWVLWIGDLVP